MYLLISLLLGAIAFVCTVSWKEFGDTVVYGIISGILTWAFSWWCLWSNQPVISMAYGVWIKYMLIPAIFTIILKIIACAQGDADFSLLTLAPCIVMLLGLIYCLFSSTAIGASRDMQRMLDVTEMSDSAYCRDMAQIQPESMILVDEELALKYAQAALEQDPATGSICEIRGLSIQNLNGTFNVRLADGQDKTLTFHNEQVYVAPLEHRDYFKWKKNRYTPGYILVSAMKQNVVYFVTKVNGDDLQLRYLESACFADYWERYVRHRYSNVKFADCNIELDDNGRPFMIIPIKENTKAYTCPEITRVVTLDIQTGAMKEYSLQDVPVWVDRIYPSYIIEERISWWGLYQRGWWNAGTAQIGVKSQTPGIEQVYTDGDCYWYTGIQSAGADDGTSGFMLTNTRTGKSKLYQISGVNEEASRQKIRNYKIDAANIYPSVSLCITSRMSLLTLLLAKLKVVNSWDMRLHLFGFAMFAVSEGQSTKLMKLIVELSEAQEMISVWKAKLSEMKKYLPSLILPKRVIIITSSSSKNLERNFVAQLISPLSWSGPASATKSLYHLTLGSQIKLSWSHLITKGFS